MCDSVHRGVSFFGGVPPNFWGVPPNFGGVFFLGVPPNIRRGVSFLGVPPNFRGVPPNFGGFLQIFLGGWGVVSFFGAGGFLQIFGGGSPPEYGQRSAGTHPTGMHSCVRCMSNPSCLAYACHTPNYTVYFLKRLFYLQ